MKHDNGWYVVDKLVMHSEGAEMLPMAGAILATQFEANMHLVSRFVSMSCRLVDKLVSLRTLSSWLLGLGLHCIGHVSSGSL